VEPPRPQPTLPLFAPSGRGWPGGIPLPYIALSSSNILYSFLINSDGPAGAPPASAAAAAAAAAAEAFDGPPAVGGGRDPSLPLRSGAVVKAGPCAASVPGRPLVRPGSIESSSLTVEST